MAVYLLQEQSTEAYTPGLLAEPVSGGGWRLPNDDTSADLRHIPWLALVVFVLFAGFVYFVEFDDSGSGDGSSLTIVKLCMIGFWGLITGLGGVSSIYKLRRRRRLGDTLLEVSDLFVAPGVSVGLRLTQTQSLSATSIVMDVVCVHTGLGSPTELWQSFLCELGPREIEANQPIWEGTLKIPTEADVPRLSNRKLEDRDWDPPLNEVGPSLDVQNRAGGRSWQSRFWKLRVSIQPAEGPLFHEYFDFRVYFPEDRQTLLETHRR